MFSCRFLYYFNIGLLRVRLSLIVYEGHYIPSLTLVRYTFGVRLFVICISWLSCTVEFMSITSHHIISCRVTSYHITSPRDMTSHYTTSHQITSHHHITLPHDMTWHHITPYHHNQSHHHNPQWKPFSQEVICFTFVNSSTPHLPKSLPNPLCLHPPHGAWEDILVIWVNRYMYR